MRLLAPIAQLAAANGRSGVGQASPLALIQINFCQDTTQEAKKPKKKRRGVVYLLGSRTMMQIRVWFVLALTILVMAKPVAAQRDLPQTPWSSQVLSSASRTLSHSGTAEAFKTTFEVFPRVGPDNPLEGLTERSVGLIAHRPGNVDELFVALFK